MYPDGRDMLRQYGSCTILMWSRTGSCSPPSGRSTIQHRKTGQGPDIGTNYRSVIFYHTPDQKQIAAQSKEELERSGRFKRPVVTEIVPAMEFWRAEEYHQQYHEKHGGAGCRLI